MNEDIKYPMLICGVAIILISNIVTALLVKDIIEERQSSKECIVFSDSRYCKEG